MIKRIRVTIGFVLFSLVIVVSQPVRADFFGGDIPILLQILAQSIQQLTQLKAILGTGEDTLGLLRDINRGINDSLGLYRTAFPDADPGLYNNWS